MKYRILSAFLVVFGFALVIIIITEKTHIGLSEFDDKSSIPAKSSTDNKEDQNISLVTENKAFSTNDNVLGQQNETDLDQQLEPNDTVSFEPLKVSKRKLPRAEIIRSDDEWRRILSPDQFYVLREKGTEPPFSGEYTDNHQTGNYYCAACHLKLFSSKAKFNSETGWASFYQPFSKKAVIEEIDNEYETERTEILCSRCHSHLGHVFKDGPKPTGLRYCINSTALKFEKYK